MVGGGQIAILCHVSAEAEHVKIARLMDIFTHFCLLEVCRDIESFCSWPQLDQSRSQLRGMVESPLQQHLKQNNSTNTQPSISNFGQISRPGFAICCIFRPALGCFAPQTRSTVLFIKWQEHLKQYLYCNNIS